MLKLVLVALSAVLVAGRITASKILEEYHTRKCPSDPYALHVFSGCGKYPADERINELKMKLKALPFGDELALDKTAHSDFIHAYGSGKIKPKTAGSDRGYVYKITPAGGAPMFVFGTQHLCGEFYTEKLMSAFRQMVNDNNITTVITELSVQEMELLESIQDEETMDLTVFRSVGHLESDSLETLQFQTEMMQKLLTIKPELMDEMNVPSNPFPDNAYMSGDEELLWYTGVPVSDDPREVQAWQLTYLKRNIEWMTTLRARAPTNESTVFVVGAGHLYGKHGILNLSKQEGWTVERYHKFQWPALPKFDPSTSKAFRAFAKKILKQLESRD